MLNGSPLALFLPFAKSTQQGQQLHVIVVLEKRTTGATSLPLQARIIRKNKSIQCVNRAPHQFPGKLSKKIFVDQMSTVRFFTWVYVWV